MNKPRYVYVDCLRTAPGWAPRTGDVFEVKRADGVRYVIRAFLDCLLIVRVVR